MTSSAFLSTARCTVCGSRAEPFDVVDFNKSCEEVRGRYLPLLGEPIYYARCDACGFCFAPEMLRWPMQRFADAVYNEGYAAVDPDYAEVRPRENATRLATLFPDFVPRRHLDFGGGNGLLSRTMRELRWNSWSYDPFVDADVDPATLGTFDLVSAFEVFEHVPDIHPVMAAMSDMLRDNGAMLFSTTVSDGEIVPHGRLTWWYAAPRNGHISLFSRRSLELLGEVYGFRLVSLEPWLHLFVRAAVPDWARHLVPEVEMA